MREETSPGDKEHEPTERRLEEARKQGDLPRSPDLMAAASYAGFLLACLSVGPEALGQMGKTGATLIAEAGQLNVLTEEAGAGAVWGWLRGMLLPAAPFLLFPMLAVLGVLIGQQALNFVPDKLAPKLSRISPIATLAHKFGREGLFEFAKSAIKLVLVAAVLGLLLALRTDEIVATLHLEPALATVELLHRSVEFLALVLLLAAGLGVLDAIWQRIQYRWRNRMSRQELLDEFRQSEGDPHMKAQRRQRGEAIAMNRMLLDVPRADVVIVNPTHYAVALRWKRSDRTAPICVAKGLDEVAARIRARAAEAGVPIHSDPPTARALHAGVDIGKEIRPEHYQAVAAAIRFSEAMRAKARERGQR